MNFSTYTLQGAAPDKAGQAGSRTRQDRPWPNGFARIKRRKTRVSRWKAAAALSLLLLLSGCFGLADKYALRETGIEQADAGDYESAIQSFDQALARSNGLVSDFELDVLKYRAEAECAIGDFDASLHTYDVLRQVDGDKPEYLIRCCILHLQTGALDQAMSEYQKACEQNTGGKEAADALLYLGQELTDAGRFDEAMTLYETAMNDGTQSGELYNRMGLCEADAGNYDRALEYLEKGLQTGDADARKKLLFNRAVVCEKKLDFAGALSSLEAYAAEFGTTPEIEKELAFLRTR